MSEPTMHEKLMQWASGRFNTNREQWRRRARAAMTRVVESYINVRTDIDPRDLSSLVDAAYPFGERRYHPYKMWLSERKILHRILFPEPALAMPTLDDFGACEVATDLLAMADDLDSVRKHAEAKAMRDEAHGILIRQAPNRMNRKCPVCGAKVGEPCTDAIAAAVAVFAPSQRKQMSKVLRSPQRLVPHLSRVEPSANGPLFGGVTPV